VELVANGIKGGTAGNKGSATGSGTAGAAAGAAGFGLLFLALVVFAFGFIMGAAPAGARQHKMQQAITIHSQSGK